MTLGPIMVDIMGTEMTSHEREMFMHPQVGGVILFARNFESIEQITELVTEIHALRSPHLLIAVDHEGGAVQRFKKGFTELPAVKSIGQLYDRDKKHGLHAAKMLGWLMAIELRCIGVDFSFAPVLDVSYGVSSVIGTRSLHKNPEVVAELAHQYMLGMREGGMSAVGKHFPGHGGVKGDSHISKPRDTRTLEDLMMTDLIPFERMIHYGLTAIMPAHVVYEAVDDLPAGFSSRWIGEILRGRYDFQGVIFSDDLGMDAADLKNSYLQRAELALKAGCDMALVCNQPREAEKVLHGMESYSNPVSQMRLVRMHGSGSYQFKELKKSEIWQHAVKLSEKLRESHEAQLDS